MRYDTLDSAVSNLDSEDVARHIAAGANINQRYDTGDGGYVTLLILFASNGSRKHVDLLLHHHADPNAADSQGDTPLHEAARDGNLDIAATLHRAAANGRLQVVKLLIMMGADKHAGDNIGATALLLAVNNGKGEVARVLAAPLEVQVALRRDLETARNRQAR